MRTLRLAAVGLCLLCMPALLQAQEPPPRAEVDEAFLSFRYAQTSLILTALYWRDSLYLPATELLSALHVAADYEAAVPRLSGYYLDAANAYILDLRSGRASSGGRSFTIPTLAALAYQDEVYLLPSVFDLLFGWDLDIDVSNLTLRLQTTDTLPLQQQRLREIARTPRPIPGLQPPAPLRHPRERQLLAGGFARYAIATGLGSGVATASYGIAAGAEALGGDAQVSLDGTASRDRTPSPRLDGRWQFVREETGFPLSQVRIGSALFSSGLQSVAFNGIQLTNAPYQPRVRLGEFPLEGRTGPGWEVELYHNNQLILVTTADAEGRYRFSVPLTYGAALLSLRLYSPTGEVVTENVRLQVPVNFLPPGRTEYHASAGTGSVTGDQILQLRVERGLTRWLTAFMGHELHEDTIRDNFAATYAGAAVRLPLNGTVATVESAPGNLLRIGADAVFPSNARLSLLLTDHARVTPLNTLGTDRSLRGTAFVPFEAGPVPLTLRAGGESTTFLQDRAETRGYEADIVATFRSFRPGLGTRRSVLVLNGQSFTLRDELLASATLSLDRLPFGIARNWSPLTGTTLIGATLSYDRIHDGVRHLRIEAARPLNRSGRVHLTWSHEPQVHRSTFEIRYAITTAAFHATSALQASERRALLSQSLRGSIGYDQDRRTFTTGPQDWTGRAGAALQLFVDHDGDGVRGAAEQIIAAPAIEFREAVSIRLADDGTLVATDLTPYRRYSVRVVAERVPNPLWMPRDTAFSFVTDPNGFKLIQVPFYVSGVIDGAVRTGTADGRGLAGVRVLVRDDEGAVVAGLTSFSDGSFYHMGLPPGRYTVEIDPDQLQRLGMTSEPRAFTVLPTARGDFVRDLILVARTPPA